MALVCVTVERVSLDTFHFLYKDTCSYLCSCHGSLVKFQIRKTGTLILVHYCLSWSQNDLQSKPQITNDFLD